jgi:hypothetical protein
LRTRPDCVQCTSRTSELGNAEGPRQGLERGSTPLRARWSRGLTRHRGPAKSNSNCDLTTNDRGGDRLRSPTGSARSLARNGMPAFVQTPVLPEATGVGALPAQLRRSWPRSATLALRRLRPSPARNLWSFRTARRTGQCDPRATFDFEKGCGSEEMRSRQLAAGRPGIPPGSQARRRSESAKKPSI